MSSNPEQSAQDNDHYGHHLTIGPHGGIDWVRKLGLDSGRKSSDSEITGGTTSAAASAVAEELGIHRSTDCIVSKELAASSDSDLLR